MTQAPAKKDKRYNLIGSVSDPVVRKDRNDQEYMTFEFLHDGRKAKCVAFAEKCAGLKEAMAMSGTVKLFGFYEKRPFTLADGTKAVSQRFRVLWSGLPEETAAEEGAETGADASPEVETPFG